MNHTGGVALIKDFFEDRGDIILPIIISLVAHGLILYLVLAGVGHPPGQDGRLSAGKKLAMAEDFIMGQSNLLRSRLAERLKRIKSSPTDIDKMDWTVDSMPVKIASAANRANLKLLEAKLTEIEADEGQKRYHIFLKIMSDAENVFDDILLASYMVGDGTLHSKFRTEELTISLEDSDAPGSVMFRTYTSDTRRLYLNRISPQEFILQASVQ